MQTSFQYFSPIETNTFHEQLHYSSALQCNKGDGATNRRTGKKMRQPNKSMMFKKRGLRIKMKTINLSTKIVSELTLCEVKIASGFA